MEPGRNVSVLFSLALKAGLELRLVSFRTSNALVSATGKKQRNDNLIDWK